MHKGGEIVYYNLQHIHHSLFHGSRVGLFVSFLNDVPVLPEFCDGTELILETRGDKVLPDRQRHKTLDLLTNQVNLLHRVKGDDVRDIPIQHRITLPSC